MPNRGSIVFAGGDGWLSKGNDVTHSNSRDRKMTSTGSSVVVVVVLLLATCSVSADFEDDYDDGTDDPLKPSTTPAPVNSNKPIIEAVETDEFEAFVVSLLFPVIAITIN